MRRRFVSPVSLFSFQLLVWDGVSTKTLFLLVVVAATHANGYVTPNFWVSSSPPNLLCGNECMTGTCHLDRD